MEGEEMMRFMTRLFSATSGYLTMSLNRTWENTLHGTQTGFNEPAGISSKATF